MNYTFEFRMDLPIVLPVDSAHYRFFVPFVYSIPGSEAGKKQEETDSTSFPENFDEMSRLASNRSEPWRYANGYPWIAYRLASEQGKWGLLLCIDTSITGQNQPEKISFEPLLSAQPKTMGKISFDLNWHDAHKESEIIHRTVLIVDVGNTRTMALLAEETDNDVGIKMTPVYFPPLDCVSLEESSYEKMEECQIIDSWLLLREPSLQNIEKPPQARMFVEQSPALLGGGTSLTGAFQTLFAVPKGEERGFVFLSSPKRYLWCHHFYAPVLWKMIPDGHQSVLGQIKHLRDNSQSCLDKTERRQLRGNSSDGSSDDKLPITKAMSVYWIALSILERAYKQLMSTRLQTLSVVQRKIEDVHVTYPLCWTDEELLNYRTAWETAISAFARARFEDSKLTKLRPCLKMEVSEAIAAQIPYFIAETASEGLNSWLQLYGKRIGIEKKYCVRVLNVDFGGGTTDFASILYGSSDVNRRTVDIEFSYSNSNAGDSIVRKILETLIVPELVKQAAGNMAEREKMELELEGKGREWSGLLSEVTNLVLIPWAYRLFQESKSKENEELKTPTLTDSQVNQLNRFFVDILGKVRGYSLVEGAKCFNNNYQISVSKNSFNQIVKKSAEALVEHIGALAATVDCDLLYFSGKLSEMPILKEMLRENVALPATRLIFTDEYNFPEWFPYTRGGHISDAKGVTVVGAACYAFGRFPGIKKSSSSGSADSFEHLQWQLRDPDGHTSDLTFLEKELNEDKQFLVETAKTSRKYLVMRKDSRLRRRIVIGNCLEFEPVYRLYILPGAKESGNELNWETEFKVECTPRDGQSSQLDFRIVGIEDQIVSEETLKSLVTIQVNTQADDAFWKDRPTFSEKKSEN